MTVAAKYISKFNNLHGKTVSKKQLTDLYNEVAKLKLPELKEVEQRLSKVVSMKVSTIPIGIKNPVKLPAVKKSKVPTGNEHLLYGLEQIDDDADLDSKPLDGFNDTTYQVITDRILALIKAGGLIWRKPWNDKVYGHTDLAHNYVTRSIYRGGNYYLNFLSEAMGGFTMIVNKKEVRVGYKDPYFLTFKQVEELGGTVKKGEKGWPVVYFKWLYLDVKADQLVEREIAVDKNGKLKAGYKRFPGLFYYNVFNSAQCEGLKLKEREKRKKRTEKERIESAEKIVNEMPKRPVIKNGPAAFYRPSSDHVEIPAIGQFKIEQQYYSTLFHELIHSTGHPSRVERDLTGRFGSKTYAFEELIAELGASYLCGESGVLYYTMKNSAAYIKSWTGRLKEEMENDPKFFLRAASQAQKAADYILKLDGTERKVTKVVNDPKPKRKTKSSLPPVKRKASNKVAKDRSKKPIARKAPTTPKVKLREEALSGFTTADKSPEVTDLFKLPGIMGDLLGNLQRYKLAIIIGGETHSSKSQLGMQIVDAFLSLGDEVAWIDWEQGGMRSKDTSDNVARNIKPENKSKLHVNGELPRTLEAVKSLAKHFRVIALDSGSSLEINTNAWIEELRKQFPDTVWIPLMQLSDNGGVRGGSRAQFDAPVVLKTYRPDEDDYSKNYAKVFKNRGNKTGIYYNMTAKKIIPKPEDAE